MQKFENINAVPTVGASVLLGTIGVLSFIVQPGLVEGFVSYFGMTESEANDLAFIEMSGIAIATIVAAIVGRKVSVRSLVYFALIIAALGNILSVFLASNGDWFSYCRLLAGFGAGFVISTSFSLIGLTARVRRNLATYLVSLLTYGAIGLWAMPQLINTIGLEGIFLLWAVLTLLSVAIVPYLPPSLEDQPGQSETAAQLPLHMMIWALAAVLVYNSAIGLAWANLFLIGLQIDDSVQRIANALLVSQFIAIGGALVSVYLAERLSHWLTLSVGIIGGGASIALISIMPTYSGFLLAVSAFNFLWNMALPFLLASIGDMDVKGRLMAPAVSMQMIGLGAGPFIGARILNAGGTFATISVTTIQLMVASFLILTIPLLAHHRAVRA